MTIPDSIRLMIVDDHPLIRSSLRMFFDARAEIEVVAEAADGGEALLLAGSSRPGVILVDVNLPDMSGAELTKRLRTAQITACILGLSMHDDESVARGMRDAGADDYVDKALPLDQLVEVIKRCVASREAATG